MACWGTLGCWGKGTPGAREYQQYPCTPPSSFISYMESMAWSTSFKHKLACGSVVMLPVMVRLALRAQWVLTCSRLHSSPVGSFRYKHGGLASSVPHPATPLPLCASLLAPDPVPPSKPFFREVVAQHAGAVLVQLLPTPHPTPMCRSISSFTAALCSRACTTLSSHISQV